MNGETRIIYDVQQNGASIGNFDTLDDVEQAISDAATEFSTNGMDSGSLSFSWQKFTIVLGGDENTTGGEG